MNKTLDSSVPVVKTETLSLPGKIKSLLFGTAAGIVAALLLLTGAAALMTLSSVPDGLETPVSFAAAALAGFTSGVVSLRLIRSEGLVYGVISGVCVFIVHLIFGGITGEPELIKTLIFGAAELPCAALGGVISVNLLRKNR